MIPQSALSLLFDLLGRVVPEAFLTEAAADGDNDGRFPREVSGARQASMRSRSRSESPSRVAFYIVVM